MRKVIYPEINPAFDLSELGDSSRVTYSVVTGRWSIDGVEVPRYLEGIVWVPDNATKEEIMDIIRQRQQVIDDAIADALDQGVDDETG